MPRNQSTPFMGTTAAPVHQTIGELTRLLIQAGALQINTVFSRDGSGHITGLTFALPGEGNLVYNYQLPVRTERLFHKIHNSRIRVKAKHEEQDKQQAERIAWRQLLRWCEAQVALSDTGLVEKREVFLPYLLDKQGKSFFQLFIENEKKMLGAASTSK